MNNFANAIDPFSTYDVLNCFNDCLLKTKFDIQKFNNYEIRQDSNSKYNIGIPHVLLIYPEVSMNNFYNYSTEEKDKYNSYINSTSQIKSERVFFGAYILHILKQYFQLIHHLNRNNYLYITDDEIINMINNIYQNINDDEIKKSFLNFIICILNCINNKLGIKVNDFKNIIKNLNQLNSEQ